MRYMPILTAVEVTWGCGTRLQAASWSGCYRDVCSGTRTGWEWWSGCLMRARSAHHHQTCVDSTGAPWLKMPVAVARIVTCQQPWHASWHASSRRGTHRDAHPQRIMRWKHVCIYLQYTCIYITSRFRQLRCLFVSSMCRLKQIHTHQQQYICTHWARKRRMCHYGDM